MKLKFTIKWFSVTVVLLMSMQAIAQDLNSGLVSVWELENNVNDELGINNGTLSGAVYLPEGKIGGCYNFDGYNDYLNMGNCISGFTELTISAWIKINDPTKDNDVFIAGIHNTDAPFLLWRDELVGSGDQAGNIKTLSFLVSNSIDYYWISAPNNSLNNISTWFNVVATFKAEEPEGLKIYINGSLEQSGSTIGSGSIPNSADVRIGAAENSSSFDFDGKIDQPAIWNRALTAAEITQLYNSGSGLPYPLWSAPAQLSGGTISHGSLTIDYNATPGIISSTSAASGGSGNYSYQWQSSTDNGTNWSDISGATSVTYTPSTLTQTTWFRRVVTDGTETAYSNNSEITVTIPGGGGTVTSVALSSSDFTISGSPITTSGTITANLSNNAISGRPALTSSLSSTDQLLVSDGGTLKKMNISVLQSYLQSTLEFGSGTGSSLWTDNTSYISHTGGNVAVGSLTSPGNLHVFGTTYAKEVVVQTSIPTPDYVFDDDYVLKSLEEVEAFIKANKHLPEIPSAKEVEANGVDLGEMNMLLLKKIEELTLYLLTQEKRIKDQDERIEQQQKMIEKLNEEVLDNRNRRI